MWKQVRCGHQQCLKRTFKARPEGHVSPSGEHQNDGVLRLTWEFNLPEKVQAFSTSRAWGGGMLGLWRGNKGGHQERGEPQLSCMNFTKMAWKQVSGWICVFQKRQFLLLCRERASDGNGHTCCELGRVWKWRITEIWNNGMETKSVAVKMK